MVRAMDQGGEKERRGTIKLYFAGGGKKGKRDWTKKGGGRLRGPHSRNKKKKEMEGKDHRYKVTKASKKEKKKKKATEKKRKELEPA